MTARPPPPPQGPPVPVRYGRPACPLCNGRGYFTVEVHWGGGPARGRTHDCPWARSRPALHPGWR